MSRQLDLGHPAMVRLIKAHEARTYPKGRVLSATGIIEEEPLGHVNATDSVSQYRLHISGDFAGEVHLVLSPVTKATKRKSA